MAPLSKPHQKITKFSPCSGHIFCYFYPIIKFFHEFWFRRRIVSLFFISLFFQIGFVAYSSSKFLRFFLPVSKIFARFEFGFEGFFIDLFWMIEDGNLWANFSIFCLLTLLMLVTQIFVEFFMEILICINWKI